mmetsp:Transcript_10890/g.12616  ORF Transcript_10890/g.12616 Transcript_10890/m.12616 type:complete len:545 (-) Transcript_10890:44-1678(-)
MKLSSKTAILLATFLADQCLEAQARVSATERRKTQDIKTRSSTTNDNTTSSVTEERRFGDTAWDIMESREDVSGFWELVKKGMIPPEYAGPPLPDFNTSDFPYPIIGSNYFERQYWLMPIAVFVPTNDALEAFEPFGDPLKSKVLSGEWNEHLMQFLAANIVSGNGNPDLAARTPTTMTVQEFDDSSFNPLSVWSMNSLVIKDMTISTTVFSESVATILEKDLSTGNQVFNFALLFDPSSPEEYRFPAFVNIVDKVIFPDIFKYDIMQTLQNDDESRFTTFLSIVDYLDLTEYFQGFGECDEGFAAYVPVNSAFDGVDLSMFSDDELQEALLNHFVEGLGESNPTSLAGNEIYVTRNITSVNYTVVDVTGTVSTDVSSANLVPRETGQGWIANNGQLTYIDAILFPPIGDTQGASYGYAFKKGKNKKGKKDKNKKGKQGRRNLRKNVVANKKCKNGKRRFKIKHGGSTNGMESTSGMENKKNTCTDTVGWTGPLGFGCWWYTQEEENGGWSACNSELGNVEGSFGLTARQACCACGGSNRYFLK